MEQAPPTAKPIESYMQEFVVKKNDVPAISGEPTFTTAKPLLNAVDKNIINMKNDRDPFYGKLHTVTNTSHLVGGPAKQVVPSTNQRRLTPYVAPTPPRERHNYVTRHYYDQQYWLDDVNTEEACKKFIISIFDEVYLKPLWEPKFDYKEKFLRKCLDLFIDDFQVNPEEQAAVKALIKEAWYPNQHIVKLFSKLKKQLTILGE